MQWKPLVTALLAAVAMLVVRPTPAQAAGTLKDSASGKYAQIVDHHVGVVLNNGFARTEVTQVFKNDSASPIDAIYEFPVPQDAALSQMRIVLADRVMNGEVLERSEAQQIYDNQKKAGNQAGLATKDGHQNFRFSIANIPANSQATMSFVYYEPLAIDDAVGRYLYPLEDGGTAASFWEGQESVSGTFRFDLELKSAMPIEEVRMPGHTPTVTKLAEGHYKIGLEAAPADLSQDLVFYYRFPSDQPRRLELVRYRPQSGGLGTFMMVYTPGIDLKTIAHGTDYVFVLDVSGSMAGKLASLKQAVADSLHKLGAKDRFRVVAFDTGTLDVSGGFRDAMPQNIDDVVAKVGQLQEGGGTDLYLGLSTGLSGLNTDRVVSTFLITDAETNTGVIAPLEFDQLVRKSDVRIFGMLMGNNANWPLMEIIGEASGGFYSQVSNRDDILGQVQFAFNKATHEALHDVKVEVTGAGVSDTTDFRLTKVYKGQQLLVFGRYDTPGTATLTLHAKTYDQSQVLTQNVHLPEVDTENAEIERLWALDMIHAIEKQALLGLIPWEEAKSKIIKLGVEYQLVTDYTAMIVVDDATFEELGVERLNEERTDAENGGGPSGGSGSGSYSGGSGDDSYGGAVDAGHLGMLMLLGGGLSLLVFLRRRRDGSDG